MGGAGNGKFTSDQSGLCGGGDWGFRARGM